MRQGEKDKSEVISGSLGTGTLEERVTIVV